VLIGAGFPANRQVNKPGPSVFALHLGDVGVARAVPVRRQRLADAQPSEGPGCVSGFRKVLTLAPRRR
jgi:hypothetical protein